MNNYNPYTRIQTYYSLLSLPEDDFDDNIEAFGISMSKIHTLTNIPLKIIRQDFLCIFQWYSSLSKKESLNLEHEIHLNDMSAEYEEINEQYNIDEIYEHILSGHFSDKFEELLMNGAFDDIPLYINTSIDTYEISFSPDVFSALQNIDDLSSDENFGPFRQFIQNSTYPYAIKDSYLAIHHYKHLDLNKTLSDIHAAIENGYYVNINYISQRGNLKQYHIHPVKITYDTDENLYSILYFENNQIESLRLDFIAHLNLDTRHHAPDNAEMEHKLCEIAPNVWGNLFHDAPKSVKVKFYKEGRVWEKVRRDLECRTNGKLYEKNGFLYYEDIVYGFSKFSNWIYGYGSSAIVIEPKWLRQRIIQSLQARKNAWKND